MTLVKKLLAIIFVMSIFGVLLADFHNVGGDFTGWSSLEGDEHDYGTWASRRIFHVGDTLVFYYSNAFHNLKQVTHQEFQSCNITSPIATYSSGRDLIVLKRPGHYYFVCDAPPSHCQDGHKVDILVTPASLPRASPPRVAPSAVAPSASFFPTTAPSSSTPNQLNHNSAASLYSFKILMPLTLFGFLLTA